MNPLNHTLPLLGALAAMAPAINKAGRSLWQPPRHPDNRPRDKRARQARQLKRKNTKRNRK